MTTAIPKDCLMTITGDMIDLMNYKGPAPFMGIMLANMERELTNSVERAAMMWHKKKKVWRLQINPEFYMKLNKAARLCVLQHELWHLALLHPWRMEGLQQKRFNVAADIICNHLVPEIIHELPWVCVYKKYGLKPDKQDTVESIYRALTPPPQSNPTPPGIIEPPPNFGDEEEDDTSSEDQEDYDGGDEEEKAEEEQPQGEETGETKETGEDDEDTCGPIPDDEYWGGEGVGNHNAWNADSEDDADVPDEEALEGLKKLIEDSVAQGGWGTTPAEVQEYIKSTLRPSVNWRHHLRVFGQAAINVHKRYSIKRESRRYGNDYRGLVKRTGGFILVGSDSSGSIGKEDIKRFYAELRGMTHHAQIDIAVFDTRIVAHLKDWNRRPLALPVTGGGTDPQCVFDLAEKLKPDAIVILTDGAFGDVDKKGFKTLYVITPTGILRDDAQSIKMT